MDSRDALIAVQAVSTAGLGWPGRGRWALPLPVRAVATAAAATGTALMATAMATQGTQLTPRAEPPAGAQLMTGGPYRFSRHPMYAGLVLGGAGIAVLRRRVEPLAAWAVLAAVLHVKSRDEDRWLAARFGGAYEEYAARTPRVLGTPRRAT